MLQKLVDHSLAGEEEPLPLLREIFYAGSETRPFWSLIQPSSVNALNALRYPEAVSSFKVEKACRATLQWLALTHPLFSATEHHCEPANDAGLFDMVVQIGEDFFELVEPDYAIQLNAYPPEQAIPEEAALTVSEPEVPRAALAEAQPAALQDLGHIPAPATDDLFGAPDALRSPSNPTAFSEAPPRPTKLYCKAVPTRARISTPCFRSIPTRTGWLSSWLPRRRHRRCPSPMPSPPNLLLRPSPKSRRRRPRKDISAKWRRPLPPPSRQRPSPRWPTARLSLILSRLSHQTRGQAGGSGCRRD